MDDELRFHLESMIQSSIRAGMTPEEARRAALLNFGGMDQTKEKCCDTRRTRLLDDLWQDLRYAARTLEKNRGFAFAAIGTLALGIGATTAIFSVIYSVLYPTFPFAAPDRLVYVSEADRQGQGGIAPSLPAFIEWREKNDVFEELTAYRVDANLAWTDRDEPERIQGVRATANIFRMAGVQPFLGRDFDADSDRPGKGNVVILGYNFWQRRYAGNAEVIGKSVVIDRKPCTVIGVMPEDRGFPGTRINYCIPWILDEDPIRRSLTGGSGFTVVGRLKDGISLENAHASMNRLARQLAQQNGRGAERSGVRLDPLTARDSSMSQSVIWTLFGAVLFVLLIACVNVANLLLARASVRRREISVRLALGAARFRILRQLFTESLLLSLLGGATGVVVACWGVRLFVALKAPGIPGPGDARLDPVVLALAVAGSILTAFLFGTLPALAASRPDLTEALKQGTGSATSPGTQGVRSALVVTQLAMALILLAGAGLMMNSFLKLESVELGFDPRNVITLRLTVPELESRKTPIRRTVPFVDALLERFRALPQVRAAAASSLFPLDGSTTFTMARLDSGPSSQKDWQLVEPVEVTEAYFRAMGIPLLRGRLFTQSDGPNAPAVALVSREAARMFWPDENPVGKKLSFVMDTVPYEVIGVVGNARYGALQQEYGPKIFRPLTQFSGGFPWITFLVRTSVDPRKLAATLRKEVWKTDPLLPIDALQTMEDLFEPHIATPRFYLSLFGFFALVAVCMAAIGIYGLINYSVEQRTQEIGIRMAMGARERDVLVMVLKHGLILVSVGTILGLAGAAVLTRFIKGFLFGVAPTDVPTFGLVSVSLIALAILTSFIPARRATKVDPIITLRCE